MSMDRTEPVTCPRCGKVSDFIIWESLNADIDPEAQVQLIDGSIFHFTCPECGHKSNVNYGMLYHDMTNRVKLFEKLAKGCYQMADVLAVRDEYRAQQWAILIQECKASGMSNKEFCIQRGVSEKSFYYWQKKLRTKLLEAAAPQLIQLEPGPAPAELLQISFRGAELKLPVGVDMDAVSAILRSIQSL